MQDGVGLGEVFLFQHLDRLSRREHHEFDASPLGFALYVLHDRQRTVHAGADNQPSASPRDILMDGQWRMAKGIPVCLGWLLLPLAHLAPVDRDIVVVSYAIDPDRPERESLKPHSYPRKHYSGAKAGTRPFHKPGPRLFRYTKKLMSKKLTAHVKAAG